MDSETRAVLSFLTEDEEGAALGRYMAERYYLSGASNPLDTFGTMLRTELEREFAKRSTGFARALAHDALERVDWRALALELNRHYRVGS